MFDRRAFASIPLIVLGALVFGGIFGVLAFLADHVSGGTGPSHARALAFGGIAGLAYLGVAIHLYHQDGDAG